MGEEDKPIDGEDDPLDGNMVVFVYLILFKFSALIIGIDICKSSTFQVIRWMLIGRKSFTFDNDDINVLEGKVVTA